MSDATGIPGSSPRRLLMISHAFPPMGGAAVQRSAKFAKFLPEFGWSPTVWTSDRVNGWPMDETLLADLPANFDRRTLPNRTKETGADQACAPSLPSEGDGLIDRPAGGDLSRRSPAATQLGPLNSWRMARLRRGFRRWMMPDELALWALSSVSHLSRIVRDEGIDAIYSTYSPASNHLAAWRLKRITGKPWIADFRDLWTDNYDQTDSSPVRRKMRSWFQDRFLEAANVVVGVSPEQTKVLADHLPQERSKFVTITNGVDAADFEGLEKSSVRAAMGIPSDRFIVSHVGTITVNDHPREVFDGFRMFLDSLGEDRKMVQLRLVGRVSQTLLRVIREAGGNPVLTGYVAHRDAVREMVAADCLLLMNPTEGANCATVRPAKVYEYLASGRYVLQIGVPGGAADQVITSCNAGETVPPDPLRISEHLHSLWTKWRKGSPRNGCPPQMVRPFTRRDTTARLASILDVLVKPKTQPISAAQHRPDPVTSVIPRIAIRGL